MVTMGTNQRQAEYLVRPLGMLKTSMALRLIEGEHGNGPNRGPKRDQFTAFATGCSAATRAFSAASKSLEQRQAMLGPNGSRLVVSHAKLGEQTVNDLQRRA